MIQHLAIIETGRPKIIQWTDPADRRILRQSILGGDATSKFGVPMSVHYPLSGGVGVISNAQFRIVREATDGDIAMALANSAVIYGHAAEEGMDGLAPRPPHPTIQTMIADMYGEIEGYDGR